MIKNRISYRLLLVAAFYSGLLLYIYPHWPSFWQEWAILLLLGLPYYILLDWIIGFVIRGKIGENVAQGTTTFSRLVFGLIIVAGVIGVVLMTWEFISYILQTYLKLHL